jgi:FAD:protein FMN transferase
MAADRDHPRHRPRPGAGAQPPDDQRVFERLDRHNEHDGSDPHDDHNAQLLIGQLGFVEQRHDEQRHDAVVMIAAVAELRETFPCFGSECTVIVADEAGNERDSAAAVELAKRSLLEWHGRFSRFEPGSELSRLNADPRAMIPVSPLMRRIVEAALSAARQTDGLVDATLIDEIEAAGYDRDLGPSDAPEASSLKAALALAPPRAPAGPSGKARWLGFEADRRAGTITRPPGVKLDGGGIAKGVFADELAATLSRHGAFVVDCCGDLRLGGTTGAVREVHVESPFDADVLHTFELAAGAVATSGIGRRAWLDSEGRPAHHLLDPATGLPAFTGVVQVTALAPTALEAETRSKAALLSGPGGAEAWLPHGGVVVLDDGSHRVVAPGAQRKTAQ